MRNPKYSLNHSCRIAAWPFVVLVALTASLAGCSTSGETNLDEDLRCVSHRYDGVDAALLYVGEIDEIDWGERRLDIDTTVGVDGGQVCVGGHWSDPQEVQRPLKLRPGPHQILFQGKVTVEGRAPDLSDEETSVTPVDSINREFEPDTAYALIVVYYSTGYIRHAFVPLGKMGEVPPYLPAAGDAGDRSLSRLMTAIIHDANSR